MTGSILLSLLATTVLASEPVLISSEELVSDATVFFSPNRSFRVVGEFGQGTMEFVPFRWFELQDSARNVLYRLPGANHTVFDVADDGAVVGIDFDGPVSGQARLHFYDPQGRKYGQAEIGFLNRRAFSDNSRTYWVLDGRAGLRQFTSRGRELGNYGMGIQFAVSADGSRAALAQESAVVMFADGQAIARFTGTTPFVRQLAVSDDGKFVGWVERDRLVLCGFGRSSPLFETGPPEPGMQFISLDISPSGTVLAGLDEGKPHRRGLVCLFNTDGTVLWKEPLEYWQWHIAVPAVRFLGSHRFVITTANRRALYEFGGQE